MFLKNFSKEEKSWIMYDWANSVYATIMVAAVFPAFFLAQAGGEGSLGSMWWGYGTSIGTAALALCAPVIGALIDYKGYKKKLFGLFLGLGIVFVLFAAVAGNWQLLLLGYILSNFCWSADNLIYDSFLTDVTTGDRMDKVSSTGFAMGYIGGSTIPFVISIALVMFGSKVGIDSALAVRISVVITAVWWGLFTIPFFKNVRHKYGNEAPTKGFVKETFSSVWRTAKKIVRNKGMFTFVIAYFFYIDGVGTVIHMATAYGGELGLGTSGMILALLVTQLVAMPCSLLFGKMSEKVSPLRLIIFAVIVYCGICVTGFVMGFGLEEELFGHDTAMVIFWVLAAMVGTVQGGIQAISRSAFGRLVPPEQSGEYFGFFEIFGRFAAVLGPTLYAVTLQVTGRGSFSILAIVLLFIVGLTILLAGRKNINFAKNERAAQTERGVLD